MALPSFIEMLLLMTPNFAADMQHKDAITEFHQSQSINQFTFSVFRTHQGSQQTITAKILRMLSLNETSHSMLFWATKRSKFCSQTTISMHLITKEVLAQYI